MGAMAELRKQLEEIQQALAQLQNQRPPQVGQQSETQTVINSVPAPEKFTFIKDDWKSWITHFEHYRKATKQDAKTEQSQINSLLLHMGAKVTSFLESQQRNESDFGTYKELQEFFDKSFCVTTNMVYARAKFNLRQQKAGETAQEYISCLISLVQIPKPRRRIDTRSVSSRYKRHQIIRNIAVR
jgi:hypothetical protein